MRFSGGGRVANEGVYLAGGYGSERGSPQPKATHKLLTVSFQKKNDRWEVFYSFGGSSGTSSWGLFNPDRFGEALVVQKLVSNEQGPRSFEQHNILPFTRIADGEETPLPPPHIAVELNQLNQDLNLNAVSPVVDEKGYAWTQHPQLAFFSDDGSRLTIHWVACAHEQKYGWEFSHAIVQRVTWGRAEIEGRFLWCWMETIERGELSWASSTEQWTSLCRP